MQVVVQFPNPEIRGSGTFTPPKEKAEQEKKACADIGQDEIAKFKHPVKEG